MSFAESEDSLTVFAERPAPAKPAVFHDRGPADLALRRLEQLSPLEDNDRELLRHLLGPITQHRVGADLGDDGDGSCRMIVSGWACRISETPWGGRQILDFLLPGDAIGLSLRPRLEGLYRIIALSRSMTLDARGVRDRLRSEPDADQHPGLKRALQQDERCVAQRMVDHTNRLGASNSSQGMAHLLLELRSRLAQVGLLDGDRFPMPLSQEALHEALGITVTQVYRVLTQMRRDGLIVMGSGWCEIPNPAALAASAGLGPWRR